MDEGFNFKLQKQQIREFPGSPLAGTTCFTARGAGTTLDWGTKSP